jgi:hypothetical protein
MRVFISFSQKDAEIAAKLEEVLRTRNIKTWSTLDSHPGEDLHRAIDEASADADGFIFVLGAGVSASSQLQAEWRTLLRNDSESKKPLIPIVRVHGSAPTELPAFLRNRQPLVFTTNYDDLVERVAHLLEHPNETWDHRRDEENKGDQAHRLEELKEFALALKQDTAGTTGSVEHR